LDERNSAIIVRLTQKEKQELKKKAKACGLKMEPFIRELIKGTEIKAKPPDEYVRLVREVNYIGNNINQIAHIANANKDIKREQLDMVKKLQNDIIKAMRGLS